MNCLLSFNLVFVTGCLVDKKGKILVPGMYDSVAPLTDEEKKLYEKIEFDLDEYCKDVGVQKLLHDSKARKQFMTLLVSQNILSYSGSLILFFFFLCRSKS